MHLYALARQDIYMHLLKLLCIQRVCLHKREDATLKFHAPFQCSYYNLHMIVLQEHECILEVHECGAGSSFPLVPPWQLCPSVEWTEIHECCRHM